MTDASRHHYLTSDRETAKQYATLVNKGSPALIRTIGIKGNMNVEPDPDNIARRGCYRVADNIPSKYILGSKGSDPSEDANVFRREMQAQGCSLSVSEAGRLLREVQSDSEDDF